MPSISSSKEVSYRVNECLSESLAPPFAYVALKKHKQLK